MRPQAGTLDHLGGRGPAGTTWAAGGHQVGEHLVGGHQAGEHLVNGHQAGEHLVNGHQAGPAGVCISINKHQASVQTNSERPAAARSCRPASTWSPGPGPADHDPGHQLEGSEGSDTGATDHGPSGRSEGVGMPGGRSWGLCMGCINFMH